MKLTIKELWYYKALGFTTFNQIKKYKESWNF